MCSSLEDSMLDCPSRWTHIKTRADVWWGVRWSSCCVLDSQVRGPWFKNQPGQKFGWNFNSCNNLLSSVHTTLNFVIVLWYVRFYIKTKILLLLLLVLNLSPPLAFPSQLGYNEYIDCTLSVGRSDRRG